MCVDQGLGIDFEVRSRLGMDVARGLRALDAVVAAEEQAARFFRMRSLALPNNGRDKLSR
jgi:hypothetical protein